MSTCGPRARAPTRGWRPSGPRSRPPAARRRSPWTGRRRASRASGAGSSRAGEARGELPPWYEPDPPGLEGQRLSATALQDVDGIALYLALAFRRALGPLEWGLGLEDPRKHYVSQHRPVLKAPGYDIDTLLVSYNLAMRTLEGRDTDDEALLRTLRAWTG